MTVNLARFLRSVFVTALLQSSLNEGTQILSVEAEDMEVYEAEATELRCVVTLSNPDGELVTATLEKIDTSELLTSANNTSQELTVAYEIYAASKGDEGKYGCNATIGEFQMSTIFMLSVLDHTPPYVVGNPDHYNSIDSSETLAVTCDIKGEPQPVYKWEFNGQLIGNTTLNNGTGPYVAANGSLLLDKALPTDSGVYICYGIDPITGENATSYYIITIQQGSSIWVSWYFYLIYAVVAVVVIVILVLVCFFLIGTKDICIDIRERKLRKEMQRIAESGGILPDNISSANPAYENFSEEQEEESFLEEQFDSSGERTSKSFKESTVMSDTQKIQESPQDTTSAEEDSTASAEEDSTTTKDSDDISPFVDPQLSSTGKQDHSTRKQVSSKQQSGSSTKDITPQRRTLKQKDPPKKSKAGKYRKNQKPTTAEILY